MQYLMIVHQILRDQPLYVHFSKCKFWLDSMIFIGNVMSMEGIVVDRRRLSSLLVGLVSLL